MSTLGGRVRERREALGLSQGELAERCGWVNRSSISNYERDLRQITIENAEKLAGALEVSVEWLIWGDDEESREFELLENFRKLDAEDQHAALRLVAALRKGKNEL